MMIEAAATASEFFRPLPVRPRLLHLETPASYLRRLLAMNHLPSSTLKAWTREAQVVAPDCPSEDLVLLVSRVKGGLSPSSFQHSQSHMPKHRDGTRCPRCDAGIETRYMCRLCAQGELVEQYPHAETNVCSRHLMWIGPGTTPETQISTGRNALRADRAYRRLQQNGAMDALRFLEIRSIFRRWTAAEGTPFASPEDRHASTYPRMMAVTAAVLAPACLSTVLDPRRSFALAYNHLARTVGALVPSNPEIVTDGLWQLLRPAFLTIREQCGENTGRGDNDPHSIPVPALPSAVLDNLIRPLEPFNRFLDQLTTCHLDRWRDANLRLYNCGQLALIREDIPSNSSTPADYICTNGHHFDKAPNAMAHALGRGWSGCPFCCNARALGGYNSLSETHPVLAAEWHLGRNGSVLPTDVLAGGNSRKYWWKCPKGHEYEAAPNSRSKGHNCPYCSRQRVIPGVTSLDVTHPALAQEWHPELNGNLAPERVLAGSGRAVWWLCRLKHAYLARLCSRSSTGAGCPYCANKKVLEGYNDLNTTRPELAKEWHPTLNGLLTPKDVVAGSTRQVWWRCPLHHEYPARLIDRASGRGCPVCTHKRVLVGYNDLETMAPQVIPDWDWKRNTGVSPRDITPGLLRKVWWTCPLGHSFPQSVVKHVAGQGCPYCSNRKLLPGFNDLQSRFPLLAGEWHPDKNSPLKPSQLLPGNQKLWWLCRAGHEQFETVPNRIRTRGCTRCPMEQRVIYVPPNN